MASDLEARFSRALLDLSAPVPEGLTCHRGGEPRRRFAVYRNNVTAALVGALETRFPASMRIVGEEFFRAMAARFVRAEPPRSAVLMTYGDDLPAFVEAFEPAAEVPYLADVMRLEIAVSEAYHAADAAPAAPEALSRLDPSALVDLRVVFHPAARLVTSRHPIATLWQMNCREGEVGPIEAWAGEDVLLTRPRLDVLVRRLTPGAFTFLSALRAGGSLGEAVAAGSDSDGFDASVAIAGLVSTGAVLSFSV
jgi:hypothetical protein